MAEKNIVNALNLLQSEFRSRAPELLAELYDVGLAVCAENGISEQVAQQIAEGIMERISTSWGGQIVYVPQGMALRLAARDRAIYENFTGRNVTQLARRYNLGVQQVYRILRLQRASEIASRQDPIPL